MKAFVSIIVSLILLSGCVQPTQSYELRIGDTVYAMSPKGAANQPATEQPVAVEQPAPAVPSLRQDLVAYALSLAGPPPYQHGGIPYVRGGRVATGGDCSGTMQHIYKTVAGVNIGSTTFDQYPGLEHISQEQLQPGDLWYSQYTSDQHTGMVADVNNDGEWDLINNGLIASYMHVDYSFMVDSSFPGGRLIGFARAVAPE